MVHPYKEKAPANTVLFPKITRFSTYLLKHYGEQLLSDLGQMLYDGELAALCGVVGFRTRPLTRDHCRIDPRMTFWRRNRYECTADLTVYLKAEALAGETVEPMELELYVSLDFCLEERITYVLSRVELTPPEREGIRLDDYLIPILATHEVDGAAHLQWEVYIPRALSNPKLLDAERLAEAMGLAVVYHSLPGEGQPRSVLYWKSCEVETEDAGTITVPPDTVLINLRRVAREQAQLSIFHECFHAEYHWLFYRLQELHHNDLQQIRRTRRHKNQGRTPKNPLTVLEWEAREGSRALMLPECILRPMIPEFRESPVASRHAGQFWEDVGRGLSAQLHVPKYLVRMRLLHLGYWQAQGALNFIRGAQEGGHYIDPFTFSREACPSTLYTFVLGPREAHKLYEENGDYRARIDTGEYVYVDGHICLNRPEFVHQAPDGPRMTDWANRHVDECCLRFENVYTVDGRYEFRLERVHCDEEYNRHYIDFVAKGDCVTPGEELARQGELIRGLPTEPGKALRALMKLRGVGGREKMAELALVSEGTVQQWYGEEYGYTPEQALRIVIALHLPPWLSGWFLEIAGVRLQYRGIHLLYREILCCRFMDTLYEVNEYIAAAGYQPL